MGIKYEVDGDDLTSIANKIRTKGGTSALLSFPDGYEDAVDAIQTGITPTGTKNISTNGTHDVTNYASANVAVPASEVDTGTKNINANGTHDVVGYASAAVNVPNSYSASDEGKVVQSGALVSQSSQTINENGTYDTTTKNEVVVDVQSGGGGGATVIASGTFTGDGAYSLLLFVGKKCPQTDFILSIWVANGTTMTPTLSTDRIIVAQRVLLQKRYSMVDLSANGNRYAQNLLTYPTVDGANITDRTPPGTISTVAYVRMSTQGMDLNNFQFIEKDSSGFTFHFYKGTQFPYQSGITFNWELIYFGTDPTNDIVEVP